MTKHTLTPRFVLQKMADGQENGRFPSATLFVDISGFTAVTETLMAHGKVGAEMLADVMQAVFTPLISAVYERGGFITGFAGDAFTAVFPGRGKRAKARAVASAHAMQTVLASAIAHETRFGTFTFSGRVGVAAGSVNWGILGDASRKTTYFRGRAIDQCATAEHQANDGEVVLSTTVAEALADYLTISPKPHADFCLLESINTPLPLGNPTLFTMPVLAETAVHFQPEFLLDMAVKGEFRQVVSVFINLQGNPRPATLATITQTCFALLAQYDGYLCRIDFGDKGCNLLLFWGAPTSHENDIERALNFLLDFQTAVSTPLRAGVTYRQAFAGFAGSSLREEYTCYGLSINQSARQMMAAPWGDIWLDEQTMRRADRFAISEVGTFPFKGFAEPQTIYQLCGRLERVEPFYRGTFAGRDSELAQLGQIVEGVKNGRFAGITLVSGEAGIGKSRLVHEFLNSQAENIQYFVCQSDEILRQPLNPLRYWLRRYFNQSTNQDELANKEAFFLKLELVATTTDDSLRAELDRTYSFLGALLNLYWPESLYEQLEPELRFENTLTALKTLLRAEAVRQPLLFVVEDVQWLDEESRQFLQRLPRNMEASPLGIVLTSREAAVDALFGEDTAVTHLNLSGLDDSRLAEMAQNLLGSAPSPELVQALKERAEGNPFYLEQLVLFLQEQGALMETGVGVGLNTESELLPQNVQAVLVARLDRLTQEVRNVVQTAAVLGREFEVQVLSHMLQNRKGLQSEIDQAEKAAVWVALSELNYIFHHALLRDAAYEMQLQARLEQLHLIAANTIEAVYQSDLSQYYVNLAYHFRQANEAKKELHYQQLSGNYLMEQFANGEAISAFSRSLEIAGESPYKQLELLLSRAKIYRLIGDRQSQESDINEMRFLLEQSSFSIENEVLIFQAEFLNEVGQYSEAIVICENIIKRLLLEEPSLTLVQAYQQLGRAFINIAEHEEAKGIFSQVLDIARKNQYKLEEAGSLLNLGHISDDQKRFDEAMFYYEEALQIYIDLNDQMGQCRLYNNIGVSASVISDVSTTLFNYERALEIANNIGYRRATMIISANIANLNARQGRFSKALNNMLQSLQVTRELGFPRDQARLLNNIGFLYLEIGMYEESKKYLDQSIAIRERIGVRRSIGSSNLNLTLWSLRQGLFGDAEQYARAAFSVSNEINDKNGSVQADMFLGHAQVGLKKYKEAEVTFQRTIDGAIKIGQIDGGAIIEAMCGLANLYWAEGKQQQTLEHVERTLSILENKIPEDLISPRRIKWHCYLILKEVDEMRAMTLLTSLIDDIHAFASNIDEVQMRDSFYNNVILIQEILQEGNNIGY